MEVESTLDRYSSRVEFMAHSNCLMVFGLLVGLVVFAVCLGIGLATNWNMTGIALYAFILCGLILLICACVVGWQVRLLLIGYQEKVKQMRLLDQGIALRRRAIQMAERADRQNDNVKLRIDDKGVTLEVVRSAMSARQGGHVVNAGQQAALPSPAAPKEEESAVPIPEAPAFWEITHLITEEKMPLCFVVDMDRRSPTFMQTIPAFGTILDLLSLCVIGRPGRGKSVLLLYYLCILAKYGSEIHILDPQGAFKDLMLLHGKVLPAMPATARIYYYSDINEMEAAVDNVMADIKEREKLFKPHLENGEFVHCHMKHPLVVMADELPIIAEMDIEIKQRTKEENKARKEEGLETLRIRQVTQMVKTSVLAARKYGVYFIGVSQSIDASILPTRVTAGFNSRIVFSSTLQKARMAGLETDDAKKLLPVIRRAGPGKTIYDCGRWDTPLVAAFPNMTIDDVLQYFGISMEELKALWIAELSAGQTRMTGPLGETAQVVQSKKVMRRATLEDAIAAWNESPVEIGRPKLMEELRGRGLECTDDLAKSLLKAIKRQLENEAGGAGEK